MYYTEHKSKEEMKEILESRNLIVDKLDIFLHINYAHIIYKYSNQFYDKEPNYKTGTKLSDIYNLYLFNKKLSQFLYIYINDFEHKLKREIASKATKDSAFDYLEKTFYGDLSKLRYFNEEEFKKFLSNLKNTHQESLKNSNIFSLKNNKGIIPLWIFVDELAVGQLRMFLKFWKQSGTVYRDMEITWKDLALFNKYRNVIFHMNPLKIKIKKGKNIFYLKTFLRLIIRKNGYLTLKEFWSQNEYLINRDMTDNKYHKLFKELYD